MVIRKVVTGTIMEISRVLNLRNIVVCADLKIILPQMAAQTFRMTWEKIIPVIPLSKHQP